MKTKLHPYKNDLELVMDARSGDQNAFRNIVLKHEGDVARTVVGILGQNEDAEDVGQEVFIRFYKSINQFKGESSLKTYLTRIAINLSLNRLKQKNSHATKPIERNEIRTARASNGDEKFEMNELIEKALEQLEPDSRSVVVLRLIQGYSTKETADLLDIPVGTVLSRLSRAQQKMQIALIGFGWEQNQKKKQ